MSTAVLLHASASSAGQWRSLARELAPDAHVLAPDLIGYGATPLWTSTGRFTLGHEAAVLRAVLRKVGEPVDLVGHSYGGAVALHLARTSPELVRRLVLIEPVAFHLLRDGDDDDRAGLREFSSAAMEVRNAFMPEAGARIFIDYWSGAGTWDHLPADKRAAVVRCLPKLRLEIDAALGEPGGIADVRRVQVPVLLVQGGLTQLSARCVGHRLANALPDVRYHVARGAGHMLPLTHREQVNALVRQFLKTGRTHHAKQDHPRNDAGRSSGGLRQRTVAA